MDIIQELQKVKAEIKSAKEDKLRAEGAEKSITANMANKFNVPDENAADVEIKRMMDELEDLAIQIENKYIDLEENYSWE